MRFYIVSISNRNPRFGPQPGVYIVPIEASYQNEPIESAVLARAIGSHIVHRMGHRMSPYEWNDFDGETRQFDMHYRQLMRDRSDSPIYESTVTWSIEDAGSDDDAKKMFPIAKIATPGRQLRCEMMSMASVPVTIGGWA
jgi:hypothetical protein